jgi:hypothetical protein
MPDKDPAEPAPGVIGKAVGELERLSRLTGLSEADIFNRAVPFYGFVHDELTCGGKIWLTRANGETLAIELH